MGKKIALGCVIGFVAVIIIVGLILAAYVIDSWRSMVAKETDIDEAWAQVQNVYQRRFDLVPNLAESVRAYLKHEKEIFEAIAEARAGFQDAETTQEIESASQELNSIIDDIKVTVEDTPELKASGTIQYLMIQLEGTENRIAVERGRFNETVREYNVYIKMFPRNIIAGWFGFEEKEFFEAREGADVAPELDLELD